jgi:hypothetical protein
MGKSGQRPSCQDFLRVAKSKAKYDADVAKLEDIHENKDEIKKRSYCNV